MWPLFREATRFKNSKYIKDLSYSTATPLRLS
ncbi:mitochondrial inner membrane protein required for protein import [Ascochyta lentis]